MYQERKLCQVHHLCDKAFCLNVKYSVKNAFYNQQKKEEEGGKTKQVNCSKISKNYHARRKKKEREKSNIATCDYKNRASKPFCLTDIFRDKSVFKT